jgi:hypothetical protein
VAPKEKTGVKIVDAQIHIWSKGKPSGLHRKVASFTAEEVLAEMNADPL